MNITQKDVMLLLTMALAVVSISFVFPALGLGGENVQENEIPQFNIEADRFDVAGDFPNSPGTPTSGTMTYTPNGDQLNTNQVWLEGGTDAGGYELVLLPNGEEGEVRINQWDDTGTVVADARVNVSESEPTGSVELNEYGINVEITESFNGTTNTSTGFYQVTYDVVDQPGDGGAIGERIPLVGSLFSAANGLAGMVGWIGSIIYWAVQVLFEGILNVTGIAYDITSYVFGLMSWMTTTYFGIVESAGAGWVSVFVALPGILFSLMLGKFALIGVKLIPGI